MTAVTLPSVAEVGTFLTDLMGLKIEATESSVGADRVHAVGEYYNTNDERRGIIAVDIQAGAGLGAALTRVPKGSVQDAIKEQTLPENLLENLQETLNVSANLLPCSQAGAVTLRDTTVGEDAKTIFNAAEGATVGTYELELGNYGLGHLWLVELA